MDPEHECRTLDDYRRRYAHYRRDPDLRRLHASLPIITTIDDHEICNDTWRDGAKNHDPAKDGDWHVRKESGLRAWQEWLPVRLPDTSDSSRIYRHFALGDLADLIVIDDRTRRDEMTKDREELQSPDRTMLGAEQFAWFTQQLERSAAVWRLVTGGVMIGQVSTDFMPEDVGKPLSELGILTREEYGPNPDQWDGYPAERDRLFRYLRERDIPNVVFVSGDVHSSWAVDLWDKPGRDRPPVAVEFVTTSVTSENVDDELGAGARTKSLGIEREIRKNNPHIPALRTRPAWLPPARAGC